MTSWNKKHITTNEYTKSGSYGTARSACECSYVGQTSHNLKQRYQEHIQYIKKNDPQSVYTYIFQIICTSMNLSTIVYPYSNKYIRACQWTPSKNSIFRHTIITMNSLRSKDQEKATQWSNLHMTFNHVTPVGDPHPSILLLNTSHTLVLCQPSWETCCFLYTGMYLATTILKICTVKLFEIFS
jgi:hypothetical protein